MHDGERDVVKLFSEDQEHFAEAYGAELDWTALEIMGPIETRVWTVKASGFDRKLTFERWHLPDGNDLLEVSTKVDGHEAADAQADLDAFLRKKGSSASTTQETKTKVALAWFAATLDRSAALEKRARALPRHGGPRHTTSKSSPSRSTHPNPPTYPRLSQRADGGWAADRVCLAARGERRRPRARG